MKTLKFNKGFTLIEILVVISIIAVLFLILLPQVNGFFHKTKESGVRRDFRDFQYASEMYLRESMGNNLHIENLNNYMDKSQEINNEEGVHRTKNNDPWGSAYGVEITDKKILFYSLGKDKVSTTKKYILASYYESNSLSSCTNGFSTNNININIPVSSDFKCGDDISTSLGSSPVIEDGTCENPYLINDIVELQEIETNRDACYALANDIDASITATWNSGKGFKPLFNHSNQFYGSFDGRNYEIRNLTINRPLENDVAMFRSVFGDIKNVKLKNVNINGGASVAGLIGYLEEGDVSNVSVTGSIKGSDYVGSIIGFNYGILHKIQSSAIVDGKKYTGGLIAYNANDVTDATFDGTVNGESRVGGIFGYSERGKISNVVSKGYVSGTRNVGGIGGENRSSLTKAFSSSTVNGTEYYIGGLIGWNNGDIDKSYSTGNVTGDSIVGGLTGYSISISISDTNAMGDVKGNSTVGGLIGQISSVTVTNSYAVGSVTGSSSVGGLIGSKSSSNIISSYYDRNTTGRSDTGKGLGKTTDEMKLESTYIDWDFSNNWKVNSSVNNGYPYLKSIHH